MVYPKKNGYCFQSEQIDSQFQMDKRRLIV